MGKLQNFTIEFESPYGVFISGQAAAGNVIIQLSEATNLSGLCLKVKGESKVHWTESSGSGNDRRTDSYWANETYMDEQVYLSGSPGGASYQMEAGTHKYPFSFTLPPTVPPSFEGVHGYVRYTAKATMERPWKFNHDTHSAFTVIGLLDLNLEHPQFREACQLSNDKEVSCCCWKSGSISGDIRLQRRCYVPGETIFIDMQIVNNSQSEVHSIRASLKQHVVFTANVGRTNRSSYYVATCNGPERIAPGRTEVLNNIPMVVPPIPPSRLDGCGIISIDYALKLYMKAPCTELVIPAEIVIGTVPLREAFHYLPSAQFDTTVPSQLPSAPFANQPSGDNFQIEPPSYEECATSGYVDIAEEGESSYVRGERKWCPRYPTFRQLSQRQGPSRPPLAPSQVNFGNM